MSRTLTLRIKRVYFDQILSGEKTVEYRDVKPFYERLLQKPNAAPITKLRLHYQRKRMLECDVGGIANVPTPEWFKLEDDGIEFGPRTFAIHGLKNARLIRGA